MTIYGIVQGKVLRGRMLHIFIFQFVFHARSSTFSGSELKLARVPCMLCGIVTKHHCTKWKQKCTRRQEKGVGEKSLMSMWFKVIRNNITNMTPLNFVCCRTEKRKLGERACLFDKTILELLWRLCNPRRWRGTTYDRQCTFGVLGFPSCWKI